MRKIILVSILFFLAGEITIAQEISAPQFKGNNGQSFSSYVFAQLDKRMDVLSAVCTKSVGTMQLVIDKQGGIQSVTITGDMPELLRNQLTEIAQGSAGLWTPMLEGGKKKNSIPIVMLVAIHISDGCEKLFGDVYYLNRKGFNFLKTLDRERTAAFPMNCFLLDPLYFVRDYGFQDLNPIKK